jgi:hypothetical protein
MLEDIGVVAGVEGVAVGEHRGRTVVAAAPAAARVRVNAAFRGRSVAVATVESATIA